MFNKLCFFEIYFAGKTIGKLINFTDDLLWLAACKTGIFMKQKRIYPSILMALLGFLSVGALYGGIALIISPDGSFFNMPPELISNSPFKSFLIPGIILLTTFGLFPIYVLYALIKKPKSAFLNKLNLLYDYHFAWTFAVYIGFGQIIWINIQTLIFNAVDIIHTIYSSLGIVIICIALLPQTRNNYKL